MKLFYFAFCFLVLLGCKSVKTDSETVYKSDNLVIIQLTKRVYVHTSFLQTESFGKVPCNGMIVTDKNEAVIFDTTVDDVSSEELLNWISSEMNKKIVGVVATHFHEDCLGGLNTFHNNGVRSFGYSKTLDIAKNNNLTIPTNGFEDSIILNVGNKIVTAQHFGEGHTKDNIVGYFPYEKVMFGGCLIKELNAGKGYLEDANTDDWSETVRKLKTKYPEVQVVIPGHGKIGGTMLLDYTINLFEK